AETLPPVAWDDSPHWQADRELPLNPSSPEAIPELGLAFRVEATVEEGPATGTGDDRLEAGDLIQQVRYWQHGDKPEDSRWSKWYNLGPDQWAHWAYELANLGGDEPIGVRVERKKAMKELELRLVADPDWPLADRGLIWQGANVEVQADHFAEAV